jgi:hypothetical protein
MNLKQPDRWLTTWLLFKPVSMMSPYFQTNYWLHGRIFSVKRPFGKMVSMQIDELDEIGIETTDQGPFAEDVFLILKRDEMRLRIGDPHPIFKQFMDVFGSLEGFDWRPFNEAMSCTDNRYFPCWKRPGI